MAQSLITLKKGAKYYIGLPISLILIYLIPSYGEISGTTVEGIVVLGVALGLFAVFIFLSVPRFVRSFKQLGKGFTIGIFGGYMIIASFVLLVLRMLPISESVTMLGFLYLAVILLMVIGIAFIGSGLAKVGTLYNNTLMALGAVLSIFTVIPYYGIILGLIGTILVNMGLNQLLGKFSSA
ncbi:DUF973 family protein [Saccharolobus sp. A20]|uniref:DUF973 family protein n=3 Tax=Sulfolobaceae TaxID=118883 RepID=UPI0012EA6C61|nr:DUF973 family protein [Sulfolobus sp. A20]